MGNFKNEVLQFYRKEGARQFSKNLWLDLLVHAGIGLVVGIVIFLIRDTNPMPTLLLCPAVTTLWGLRTHWKKNRL